MIEEARKVADQLDKHEGYETHISMLLRQLSDEVERLRNVKPKKRVASLLRKREEPDD